MEDFSYEHLISNSGLEIEFTSVEDTIHIGRCSFKDVLKVTIDALNFTREMYLKTKDKKYWWQLIQLLPSSYNQKRTVMLNYEVLANIYKARHDHKLDEWHDFCSLVEGLDYSELITSGVIKRYDINATGNQLKN